MKLPFHKFLDHTADVLFVARADNLVDLFKECALATEETMVDVKTVKPKQKGQTILAEADRLDWLLYDFLSDLVLFKDQQFVCSKFDLEITETKGHYELKCIPYGEKLNYALHHPDKDVKAVTMHLLKVEHDEKGWKAQVLLDI